MKSNSYHSHVVLPCPNELKAPCETNPVFSQIYRMKFMVAPPWKILRGTSLRKYEVAIPSPTDASSLHGHSTMKPKDDGASDKIRRGRLISRWGMIEASDQIDGVLSHSWAAPAASHT